VAWSAAPQAVKSELLGKPLEVAVTLVDAPSKRFTCSQKAAQYNRALRDIR